MPVAPPTPDDANPFGESFAANAGGQAASHAMPELAFESTDTAGAPALRRGGSRRGKSGSSRLLLGIALGIPLLGVCFLLGTLWYFQYPPFASSSMEVGGVLVNTSSAGNFEFRKPKSPPWQEDTSAERALSLNFAMKRSGPNNNLALLFHDYKTRSASEAELREEALTRLKTTIPQSLATEAKPADDQKTLGGLPAQVLEFEGNDANNVPIAGECYMLTYQGYAYWFFTWGPEGEREQITPEWEQVRKGFALGNNRPGWKESPRETEIAPGTKMHYQLKPVKGLWKKETLDKPELREQYEKADLVLLGVYPGDPKANVKAAASATAQVVILDKAEDLPAAIQLARDFVLEKEKDKRDGDYTYPNTTLDFVQDKSIKDINEPVGKGQEKGQLLKLVVQNDENRQRYVVLRVVNHKAGVLVLWMECDNRFRDFWETEFNALQETLQF